MFKAKNEKPISLNLNTLSYLNRFLKTVDVNFEFDLSICFRVNDHYFEILLVFMFEELFSDTDLLGMKISKG